MRRCITFVVALIALAFAGGRAHAQTITLSPTSPQVVLGGNVQFTATVTGLPSSDVVWSVEGVVGGNTAYGKITAAGLYTAPAKMSPNGPLVTATSKANTAVSASTYVLLLTPGPTITSVSPNPVPLGTFTVTVKGSGFKSGAMIYVTDAIDNRTQLSTTFVNSTTLTASIWLGGGSTSATFCVRNPGSDYSNSITVPVGFTLSVVSGTGSGIYVKDTVVTITANAPPAGKSFYKWTGADVQDASASTTTLKMPAANTTVTATYSGGESTYPLKVVNGTGSGNYAAGTVVTIKANNPPAGQAFSKWTGAAVQDPNAATTTITMPAATTTVTANYIAAGNTYALNVVNGSGSGNYTSGTVVTITANAPPAGQAFLNWTGASVQDANAATTTLTMPAAVTTVTANYTSVAVNIPYPVTTHPRLWVTTNDLAKLRSWATAANPIYKQGIVPLLGQAVNIYKTQFFPNGIQNPNYPDPGDTQGYSGYQTEQYGAVLAFNSLIDPDPNARILYAQYARNMLMVVMNQAAVGHLAGAPFRDPLFAVYNRANGAGEQWPLIVDWIYNTTDGGGKPILTPADKAVIRKVFMMWANDCLNASTTGGDHPAPVGVMNNHQLLPGNKPYRMAANNYYLGHARLLTMMALSIDPSDDPAINPLAPLSQTGNSLRSYILNANGAWLYQEYAMYGEPATVATDYGIPGGGAGFGLASGGLPPEGMLYGHSYAYVLGQLLALQTAGFNDPSYSGPQSKLIGAPVWDRFVQGYLSSLIPSAKIDPTQVWLGPVYQFASYGDLLRLWATPDSIQPFTLLTLLEQQNGQTTHRDAARWFAVNGAEGGANALMQRITAPWSYGSTDGLLYFLLLDPTLPAAPDPRPTFPTTFFDPAAGRILAHSDWSANGTMFDYRASWISINHQLGDGGQFELYRNGEWLTKEMSNYDNNAVGLTTVYHNTMALQNWCANGVPNLNWFETGEWANGSQWMLGLNAGDPTTTMSTGPNYVYAASDLTNLYNRPNIWTPASSATDITQATRSIMWLNNDYVVVYDRATSLHSGLFKRFNMSLQTNPVIGAHGASDTLPSGQQLFIQTLLPANPTISAFNGAANLNPIANMEPTRFILTVEDPSKPTDTRFLHVLQGADKGAAMVPATYLTNSAGTAFDGAAFGNTAVFFPTYNGGAFAGTTLPAPTGVHTVMVTGLLPGAAYTVSVQAVAGGSVLTITAGGNGPKTDGAGVLTVAF